MAKSLGITILLAVLVSGVDQIYFGIRKIEDFNNRMDDAESEQSKDEINLETKKLIEAEWIRPSG